jgi:hypothetical protein
MGVCIKALVKLIFMCLEIIDNLQLNQREGSFHLKKASFILARRKPER